MSKTKITRPQLNRDYEALKFEAAVLYIKHGLSAQKISEQINVCTQTLAKWNKTGRWSELLPDLETLGQLKAAALYIDKGMSVGQISQVLNISAVTIDVWIEINGWEASRLISQAQNTTVDVVAAFCEYFIALFPESTAMISVVQSNYLRRKVKINKP